MAAMVCGGSAWPRAAWSSPLRGHWLTFSLYNSDGVWRPRVAKSGLALPSARLVSINIVPDVDAPSELGKYFVLNPRTVEARCNK